MMEIIANQPVTPVPDFLNPELPLEKRVLDLIGRMTLDEKVAQMSHPARAVSRLGVPAYNFWSEALHGVARNGRATVFPQAIGMAATWDPALIQRVASAIGDEGRAKYHEAVRKRGSSGIYQGLTFWSPNVNIFRDPRWGRGQETWGEDPLLTGEMGAAFVRGLQGEHPRYLKAAACAKHYAVHSGPEKDRHTFDAVVSKRELYDTYLPAFKTLVMEAHVEAVMGAYNRTLGEPCNASQLLLQEILRGEWGFRGHVVSDCGALADIHKNHHVTKDAAESAALALKMGCDIGCDCVYDEIPDAINRGLMTEADLDRALARTLGTRFKLGMFDPPEMVPFAATPMSVVGSEPHRRLAYEAAVKSVVLLKNRNGILPLKPDIRSICVVGPTATNQDVLVGNYYGFNDHLVTLLAGIVGRVPEGVKLEYRPGCLLTQGNVSAVDWSVFEAANSDVTIACVGSSPVLEGEEGDAILSEENGDRSDIRLPAAQVDYVKKLVIQGARVVLVITGGSPLTLEGLEEMVEAIVYVWYPGQEGGRAVADVLFGDQVPSGKLPLTFPKSLDQLPPFDDYHMDNRTYRYARWEPLFPFGFGLSYTTFAYHEVSADSIRLKAGETLTARVTVTNTGKMAGEEVVQWYLSDLDASVKVPICRLVGFMRLGLEAGESKVVMLQLDEQALALVDEEGRSVLEPGLFRLQVGGSSPCARAAQLGAPAAATLDFEVLTP